MRSAIVCAAVIAAGIMVRAQDPAWPAFDVVSVKPTQPGTRGTSFGSRPGGRWAMTNRTISTLIRAAYPTPVNELFGAPAWVMSDPYDVDARAGESVPAEDITLMLRRLLAERFKLRMHYETRELPVYALVIAGKDGKPGAGLVRSTIDCEAVRAARQAGRTYEGPAPANGAPPCAWTSEYASNGPTTRFGGLPLSRLSESLGQPDGRVVIDKTGLTGNYEFTLRYTDKTAPTDDTPSLFTALQEQLGLRLVPDRAPLQVVVIDGIERPTEN